MQSLSGNQNISHTTFNSTSNFHISKMKEIQKRKNSVRQAVVSLRVKTGKFVDNPITISVIGIITIYALLADDIRQLSGNKHTDLGFDIVTYIVFSVFMVEIILSIWAKPGYLGR